MFGLLKKKLRESVGQLARLAKEKPAEEAEKIGKVEKAEKHEEKVTERPARVRRPEKAEEPEEKVKEEKPEKAERRRPFAGIVKRIREKEFSDKEISDFFNQIETGLLQANIALQVTDFLRSRLLEELVNKPVKRKDADKIIKETFELILLETVKQGKMSIEKVIENAKKENRPACLLFLGYNGSGKTTTTAKVAKWLLKRKNKPVLAAADTFRAASIEQLEVHGKNLGLNVIKHKYGADPAAVVFDARKHAESKGLDVVLADTAGRMHTNVNLMDELKKISRVNKPDLKILVVDSLTGNDVVHQVTKFNEEIGIDGMILTKMDVNEKGGSIISACYTSKKPVLFIGTGQNYEDLEEFEPDKFVKSLME